MPHEEVREENIRRVLEVGVRCLYRDGVGKLRLSTIAAEAGLSEMSMHRYFSNKEELICSLLYKMNDDAIRETREIRRECTREADTGRDQLQKLLLAVGQLFSRKESRIVCLTEAQIYLSNLSKKEVFTEQYKKIVETHVSDVREILEEGVQDGSIDPLKAGTEECAQMIWKSFWGYMIQMAILYRLGVYSREYCEHAVRRYIDLLIQEIS